MFYDLGPPTNPASPQPYRPNLQGYPPQNPHQGFPNSQYPAQNQPAPQTAYNPSVQQPPSSNQNNTAYQAPANYPPQINKSPYPQPTPSNYGSIDN